MKPSHLLITAIFLVGFSVQSSAQKNRRPDPKYTNYFHDVEDAVETREVVVEFSNGVSRMDFLKFKARFINNTNDFLLIDPSQFKIIVDGVETRPKEKQFVLDPNDKASRTIDVKEGANFIVSQFDVELGGFKRIPFEGTSPDMEQFQLPATTNVIESGNFEVNLKQVKQETQQTWARFEIKYKGDGYAIIDPSRISVKTEGGDQYANMHRKSKSILLEKGDSKGIDVTVEIPAKVVDMQFAKLFVNWGGSMVETEAVPLDMDESVTFELNETLTAEKNR